MTILIFVLLRFPCQLLTADCRLLSLMFRSAGITFGSKLLVAVVNFAIVILLSQWLGEAGKGRCSQYLLIFSAALIFSECISGSTVAYLLTRFSHRQLLVLFYGWSAVVAVITGLVFHFILTLSATETAWVVVLNWINAVVTIHQLVAVGRQKLGWFNGLNVGQALLSITSIVILFSYIGQSALFYLQAIAIAWGMVSAIGFLLIYRLPDDKAFVSWSTLAGAGFRSGIANQTTTFLQLINTRIAYLLLPAASTGIYSNAVSLCEACLLINSSIGTVQYSRLIRLQGRVESDFRKQQIDLTHQCFWVNTFLMLAALLLLGLLPAGLYSWIFGPAFGAVAQPLRLLLPGIFLYSCYIILAYFFSGTGRFGLNNYPAAVALIVTLIGYGMLQWLHLSITLSSVAIITVCSYTGLSITALLLFFKTERVALKQWFLIPWKQLSKSLFLK